MPENSILIVGAGLSGLALATHLVGAGRDVTLIESRRYSSSTGRVICCSKTRRDRLIAGRASRRCAARCEWPGGWAP